MANHHSIEIHETAFVTAIFRSFDQVLSGDRYSHLWRDKRAEKWIKKYLSAVSSEEVFTHSLRNRYFLDQINDAITSKGIKVLINFGSGFSMYPFLLNEDVINIEIDKPEITEHKKRWLQEWQGEGTLPKREINFIGVDFSKDYQQKLSKEIKDIKGKRSSFILIEGVLFFLNQSEVDGLFDLFDDIQLKGDLVGSASFRHNIKETLAFERLLGFFNDKVTKTSEDNYLTLDDEYYTSMPNYKLIDQQDYFSLSDSYGNKIRSEPDMILNECFYLLEKK